MSKAEEIQTLIDDFGLQVIAGKKTSEEAAKELDELLHPSPTSAIG